MVEYFNKIDLVLNYIHKMWPDWYLDFKNENLSKKEIWKNQVGTDFKKLSEIEGGKDRKFKREIIKITKEEL